MVDRHPQQQPGSDRDVEGLLPEHPDYASGIQGDKRSKTRLQLLRDGVVYGAIAAVLTVAFAFGAATLAGNDVETDIDRTVRILREQSELNREVLCLAVVRPSLKAELPRKAYVRIVELCLAVIGPIQETNS